MWGIDGLRDKGETRWVCRACHDSLLEKERRGGGGGKKKKKTAMVEGGVIDVHGAKVEKSVC